MGLLLAAAASGSAVESLFFLLLLAPMVLVHKIQGLLPEASVKIGSLKPPQSPCHVNCKYCGSLSLPYTKHRT